MWALLLSNPKLIDDFGCMRWTVPQLVANLFPRRRPSPLRAVRSFMEAAAQADLVEVYTVEGQPFAAVRMWSGVEPARRRYHRAPLPPSSTHVCGGGACARDGARVASVWADGLTAPYPRPDDRSEGREYARLSVPTVRPVPTEPLGSTTNGCIEGSIVGENAREKSQRSVCEVAGCRRPAVGATAGRYVCAQHDASVEAGLQASEPCSAASGVEA